MAFLPHMDPCQCIFPTEGPVSTRQDAEELTAAVEVSRFTDMWQVKLLEENPFGHGCPGRSSNSQARRGSSPLPAKAVLVCNPCCCQPASAALSWPCLRSVSVSSSAQGDSQQARNQPQKSLNSRLSFQESPTTHVGDTRSAGPAHSVRMLHTSAGFASRLKEKGQEF